MSSRRIFQVLAKFFRRSGSALTNMFSRSLYVDMYNIYGNNQQRLHVPRQGGLLTEITLDEAGSVQMKRLIQKAASYLVYAFNKTTDLSVEQYKTWTKFFRYGNGGVLIKLFVEYNDSTSECFTISFTVRSINERNNSRLIPQQVRFRHIRSN